MMKMAKLWQIGFMICIVTTCLLSSVLAVRNYNTDRLCVDEDCSKPISSATAYVKYAQSSKDGISFNQKDELTVYSKSVDPKGRWEVQKEGSSKRGFVNPSLLRETTVKVNKKKLMKVLKTVKQIEEIEKPVESEVPPVPLNAPINGVAAELGDGSSPSTPYEVFDGTTIPLGTDGSSIDASEAKKTPLETKTPESPSLNSGMDLKSAVTEDKSSNTIDNSDEDDEGDDEDDEDDEGDDGDEDEEGEDDTNQEPTEESVGPITVEKPQNNKLRLDTISSVTRMIDEILSTEPGKSPAMDAKILAETKVMDEIHKSIPVETDTFNGSPANPDPPHDINSLAPTMEPSLASFNESLMSHTTPLPDNVLPSATVQDDPTVISPNSPEMTAPTEYGKDNQDEKTSGEFINDIKDRNEDLSNEFMSNNEQPKVSNNSYHQSESASNLPDPSGNLVQPVPDIISKPESKGTEVSPTPENVGSPHTDKTAPNIRAVDGEDEFHQKYASQQQDALTASTTESPPRGEFNYLFKNSQQNINPLPSYERSISTDTPKIVPSLETDHTSTEAYQNTVINNIPDTTLYNQNQDNFQDSSLAYKDNEFDSHLDSPNDLVKTLSEMSSPAEQDTIVNASEPTPQPLHVEIDQHHLYPKAEIEDISGSSATDYDKQQHQSSPLETERSPPHSSDVGTDQANETPQHEEIPPLGFFSSLSSLFGSGNVQPAEPEHIPNQSHKDEAVHLSPMVDQSSLENENIVPEGECKSVIGLESDCADAPSPAHLWEFLDYKPSSSSYAFVCLVITAVTVLLFTLGHYFIERTRQDRPLIAKVNQLTHDLQVATAQLENRGSLDGDALCEVSNEALAALQSELDDLRRVKGDLDIQLESQQQELEAATEAGFEINKMLSDLLTQKEGSVHLLHSVEQLQGQLDSQQRVIDEMNHNLLAKSLENQGLQDELQASSERTESLEEELSDLRQNLNIHLKEKDDITMDLEARNKKLEAEVITQTKLKTAEIATLEESLTEFSKKLAVRESEFTALTETIEELRHMGGVDTKVLYDVGLTKAELSRVQKESDNLQERLGEEEGARKLLEDHVKAVDDEVSRLRSSCEAAVKEKVEAETRLTVLSNYFKEKETQLQKELGLQEAMWAQKQGDDTTVYERIKSLQDEVENYNFDSFPHSNEALSISTSLSSMTNDPGSSLPNLHMIGSKKTDSLRSLPITTKTKPQIRLSRRKSSADFESRLERAELMTSSRDRLESSSKPIPDDLLKLNELKTVRASPFRDVSDDFESLSDKIDASDDSISSKCSDMIKQFESYTKQPKLRSLVKEFKKEKSIGKIVNKFEVSHSDSDISLNRECFRDGSESGYFENEDNSERQLAYNLETPQKFFPAVPSRNSLSPTKSESEDCQSLESSATLELDIEVVANAKSKVRKMKKTTRQKAGSQNEILKKEIVDQERGLKGQLATLEKKAHENWVAARQAERRLEESKQEAGQLRNMLTLIEKSASDTDTKPPTRLPGDLNGDDALINANTPPLPFPPLPHDPLPPGFIPPPFMPVGFMPPPPFMPGDRRPAPLGRMSSPPLNNRYSPAPGGYEFDRMSPTHMLPLSRNYRSPPVDDRSRHRTPPSPPFQGRQWEDMPPRAFRPVNSQRDSRRDYQGSNLSSGHSSTDSLDKATSRHGGKV